MSPEWVVSYGVVIIFGLYAAAVLTVIGVVAYRTRRDKRKDAVK